MSGQQTILVWITVSVALLIAGLVFSQWTGEKFDQVGGVESIEGVASRDSANKELSLADCVRVLSKESETPIPLHVGGMDVDNQMVFLLEGERYGQLSPVLPLEDYPFSRTTLGDWKSLHPQSKICAPPSRASIEHRRPAADTELKGQRQPRRMFVAR